MKFNFKICNILHPNSLTDTCAFLVFDASATRTTLNIAMDQSKAQINDLQGEDFIIRVFLSEEYEFLCHMYGHQEQVV